ncbi:penicillin-binding protein 1C [Maribacter algarum]|uniref:peptidoglycan glycosyltransferase n=1 Tax=Maribacter algarum (ex Zhang et al. 2020) TaxID=2578118 RepID=A0A5S3PW30_9FLAO|nr:penicillin-binding protein 1C [Maribacter algarum]TMM59199.1 penicillin-binding protein 1C [Maribacter algarum]
MTLKDRVHRFARKHPKKLILFGILLIAYYYCLPKELFKTPTATVVESRQGTLIGAKIADDGQWRFPVIDSVPRKFETCLLQFEDAYFYKHFGFNPVSMAKAIGSNISAGKTVRGGSTLTQQVVRLSRNQNRSYFEKLIELILATRLEFRHSKEDILKLYASHAPYGGNVVGLDVASWRYFGLQPHQLSWAESATLAVLPNAPSLIYPGKNQQRLLDKRNRLLKKLLAEKYIDSTTYHLALLEALPLKPYPLPKIASHLVEQIAKNAKGQRIKSSLDENLQQNVNSIVQKYHQSLRQNQVHNAAVLVLDVNTKEVLSYVGNTQTTKENQKDVDMVQANRSTGSTIKPLLYAAMLDAGELIPDMLVPDVPTQIAGYTPENFNEDYSGAVQAKSALARSLNIPAVRLLQSYGLAKFRDQLDVFQLGGLNQTADHYGLTLILGGAESNLWDLCKTYMNLASTLNHFNATSSEYFSEEFTEPTFGKEVLDFGVKSTNKTVFDAASIYLTFEAMKEVNRPDGNESWEFYDSSKEIAWKTGTSFGNKDAWTIGVTTDYVVGVWVGNADGEGRPNVTGVTSAAPILFDVFDVLPRSDWFQKPFDEFVDIDVCAKSGYLTTDSCPRKTISIPNKPNYVNACNFHQMVQLDVQKQFRVNSSCVDLSTAISESWFSLPPLMEFYYKRTHPLYKPLPPFRNDCKSTNAPPMEFIYPKNGSRISLTKNFNGEKNEVVLKLAHAKPETGVYWYLDDRFISQTKDFHEIGLIPDLGRHKITVVDALGNEVSVTITIE